MVFINILCLLVAAWAGEASHSPWCHWCYWNTCSWSPCPSYCWNSSFRTGIKSFWQYVQSSYTECRYCSENYVDGNIQNDHCYKSCLHDGTLKEGGLYCTCSGSCCDSGDASLNSCRLDENNCSSSFWNSGLRKRTGWFGYNVESSYTECSYNGQNYVDGKSQHESCNRRCFHGGALSQGESVCTCPESCCEFDKPRSLEPTSLGSCNNICNWSPWEPWSNCSALCGEQQRVRYLCCLKEYGGFENCSLQCGWNASDRIQRRSCGGTCLHGGTLKETGVGCDCLNRSFGDCCEELLDECIPFPTDVIFVLDSSASQTKEQFQVQLDFVTKFVENVNVSAEEFQIAVVTFSTEARVEINFNQSTSADYLRQLIGDIKFRPGATFTDKGLLLAREVARKSERRKGMVTLTHAFVLTDGMSNKRIDTRAAAAKLKAFDVHVVAIGIGKQVSHQELHDIASPGDEFSPSYVLSVREFNALNTLLKQLVHVTCDNCSTVSQLSDIVFLVDNGNDMSEEEFQLSVDVMESIINQTDNIGEADGPLFGILQLNNELELKVKMSVDQTQQSLFRDLQKLQKSETDICVKDTKCKTDNITSAVHFITESILEEKGREKSRKFLVVISNGRFENANLVKKEISAIQRKSDVKVFVIGPGTDINMNGLLSLADEAIHVYAVLDKEETSKLDVMQSEFAYYICH